ncbi:MAG: hypothetical protein K2O13_07740 [Lachnospiraceae bacterium]|nr:hypothetical protein [Lachnospiraceae bacterium]
MKDAFKGKDTAIGHWQIAEILLKQPLLTYPGGVPKEVLDICSMTVGRGMLCGRLCSVIKFAGISML